MDAVTKANKEYQSDRNYWNDPNYLSPHCHSGNCSTCKARRSRPAATGGVSIWDTPIGLGTGGGQRGQVVPVVLAFGGTGVRRLKTDRTRGHRPVNSWGRR